MGSSPSETSWERDREVDLSSLEYFFRPPPSFRPKPSEGETEQRVLQDALNLAADTSQTDSEASRSTGETTKTLLGQPTLADAVPLEDDEPEDVLDDAETLLDSSDEVDDFESGSGTPNRGVGETMSSPPIGHTQIARAPESSSNPGFSLNLQAIPLDSDPLSGATIVAPGAALPNPFRPKIHDSDRVVTTTPPRRSNSGPSAAANSAMARVWLSGVLVGGALVALGALAWLRWPALFGAQSDGTATQLAAASSASLDGATPSREEGVAGSPSAESDAAAMGDPAERAGEGPSEDPIQIEDEGAVGAAPSVGSPTPTDKAASPADARDSGEGGSRGGATKRSKAEKSKDGDENEVVPDEVAAEAGAPVPEEVALGEEPIPEDPSSLGAELLPPPPPPPAPTTEDEGDVATGDDSADNLLNSAKTAYRRGDVASAHRLASESNAKKSSVAAVSIMTRAACRLNDEAKAKDAFNRLPVAERNVIRRECRQYGVRVGL